MPRGAAPREPLDVELELATLEKEPPTGDAWWHETKFDGYRMAAHVDGVHVRLVSRNGKNWAPHAPSVVEELAQLGVRRTVIDGELVALRPDGRSDFGLLQRTIGSRSLVYVAFDLLVDRGTDLRTRPLVDRFEALRQLLTTSSLPHLRLSDHIVGHGDAVYAKACELGLEGIVSKRIASPYRGGRGRDWIKVKCHAREHFLVVGFRRAEGARNAVSSLVLGVVRGETLVYVGKVGTGFTSAMMHDLHEQLAPFTRASPPVTNPPRGAEAKRVVWVTPRLAAEVHFTEWTRHGTLRHPIFRAIRALPEGAARPTLPPRARPPLGSAGSRRLSARPRRR